MLPRRQHQHQYLCSVRVWTRPIWQHCALRGVNAPNVLIGPEPLNFWISTALDWPRVHVLRLIGPEYTSYVWLVQSTRLTSDWSRVHVLRLIGPEYTSYVWLVQSTRLTSDWSRVHVLRLIGPEYTSYIWLVQSTRLTSLKRSRSHMISLRQFTGNFPEKSVCVKGLNIYILYMLI